MNGWRSCHPTRYHLPDILPFPLPGAQLGTSVRKNKNRCCTVLTMNDAKRVISVIRCVIVVPYLKNSISHRFQQRNRGARIFILVDDGLLVKRQIRNSFAHDAGPGLAYCCHWSIRPCVPRPATLNTTCAKESGCRRAEWCRDIGREKGRVDTGAIV